MTNVRGFSWGIILGVAWVAGIGLARAADGSPIFKLTYGGPIDSQPVTSVVFWSAKTDSAQAVSALRGSQKRPFDYSGDAGFDPVVLAPATLDTLRLNLDKEHGRLKGSGKPGEGRYLSLTILRPEVRMGDAKLIGYTTDQYFLDIDGWKRVWPAFGHAMFADPETNEEMQTALDRFTAHAGLVIPEE